MTFTRDWVTQHAPIWQAVVLPRLPAGRRRWLELGSYEGRSALWTLDNALRDGDELVCVDGWWRSDIEAAFDANVGSRARKVKATTEAGLLGLIAAGERFDVVYVDAEHDAAAVMRDCVLAWMLLAAGGLLVIDDYRLHNPPQYSFGRLDVRYGVDGFLSAYRLRMQVLHMAWQVIAQKAGE